MQGSLILAAINRMHLKASKTVVPGNDFQILQRFHDPVLCLIFCLASTFTDFFLF